MPCWLPQQTSSTAIHQQNKHPFSQPKQRQSLDPQPAQAVEGNHHTLKHFGRFEELDGGLQGQQTTPPKAVSFDLYLQCDRITIFPFKRLSL